MEKILILALRIISYIVLPVGSYLTYWERNSGTEKAVIVALLIIPILIILFLGPDQFIIRRPTIKILFLNLIPIIILIFIGLLPVLFWALIVLIIAHPACGHRPLTDIFPILYCLINQ